jgi:hypothetical protein
MSYSTQAAELLTKQLKKFATLNRHQFAGQAANFDFWMAEVYHCLTTIDGYNGRFIAMRDAQNGYAKAHSTVEFNLGDPNYLQHALPVKPPNRVPDLALNDARQSLCDAAEGFLNRCIKEGLIDITRIDDARERLLPSDDPPR